MNYSDYVENLFVDRKFINPYSRVDPNYITQIIFYDGRLLDDDAPAGFRLQRKQAKRCYNKWLRGVRSVPGWENFRRPRMESEH